MLDKKKKDRIIEKYKTHKSDTGSPEVQIVILTAEIKELTEHLKEHKKDYSSRRGLIKKVAQRRRLLQYLQRENEKSYENITKKLKIKKRLPETMVEKDEEDTVIQDNEDAKEEESNASEK